MKVSITYATAQDPIWKSLDVAEGTTVEDVIRESGLLERYVLDLKSHKVGIFGKLTKLNAPVKEGDRVEIYTAITRVLDEDDEDDDDDKY